MRALIILFLALSFPLYGQPDKAPVFHDDMVVFSEMEYTQQDFSAPKGVACLGLSIFVDQALLDQHGSAIVDPAISTMFQDIVNAYDSINVTIFLSEYTPISGVTGTSTGALWTSFSGYDGSGNNLRPYVGDIALFVTEQASGGIAAVDQLGQLYPYAVSSVRLNNMALSEKINVHEIGHVIGAFHSHACVWGPNLDEALDGCAGFTEYGDCDLPVNLTGGWMSYCHIGGNDQDLFYDQIGNLIYAKAANHNQCSAPPPPTECENELIVEILLDDHPGETTWSVGEMTFGPYTRNDTLIRDTFCLSDGCHTFTIFDSFGDGLSGGCFSGYYALNGAQGQDFNSQGQAVICFGDEPEPPAECEYIDQTPHYVDSDLPIYGATDKTVLSGDNFIAIQGPFTITENTVLNADYKSNLEPNVSGIVFSNSLDLDDGVFIQMYGTDIQGYQWLNYYDDAYNWLAYNEPIGEYMLAVGGLGTYQYMLLVNVVTDFPMNAQSEFKRIRLCEDVENFGSLISPDDQGQIFNLLGQPVHGTLPPGVYIKNGKKVFVPLNIIRP